MAALTEAFYGALQPGALGQRLCLWHADAAQPPRALVVHLHAFAEEMNKARRMAALQARALAAAGCAVLQIDLLGCGDSAGDFGDASWQAWLDDAGAAVALARQRHARCWPGSAPSPLWLWGHRAGALLAAQVAARLNEPVNLLLWQPATAGRSVLQQFLRLDSTAALLGKGGGDKGRARAALARGETPEVAGYRLAPALAGGLEAARLDAPPLPARLEWLDVAGTAGLPPAPAAAAVLQAWTAAGWHARQRTVAGPSFWQTTEIEQAPALISATVEAVLSAPARPALPAQALPQVAA